MRKNKILLLYILCLLTTNCSNNDNEKKREQFIGNLLITNILAAEVFQLQSEFLLKDNQGVDCIIDSIFVSPL
jgi:hypothetical protein